MPRTTSMAVRTVNMRHGYLGNRDEPTEGFGLAPTEAPRPG